MKSSKLLFFDNQIGLFTNFTFGSSLIATIFMNLNIKKRVYALTIFACSYSILAIIKMKIINVFIEIVYALLKWHQFFTILILTFYKTCIVEIFYIRILWNYDEIIIQANSINKNSKLIKILIFKLLFLFIFLNKINLRTWTLKKCRFHLNHARLT